jgi:hypothetical protein
MGEAGEVCLGMGPDKNRSQLLVIRRKNFPAQSIKIAPPTLGKAPGFQKTRFSVRHYLQQRLTVIW